MNPANTSRSVTKAIGPLVLMVAALAVTWTAAMLLTAKDSRTDKFFLSLAALSIVEIFTFGYALVPVMLRKPLGGNAPSFMMGWIVIAIYDAGALVLVLIGLAAGSDSSLSYDALVVMHLVWSLLALILVVVSISGASKIAASGAAERAQRASFVVLRNQFSEYCDQLVRIPSPEARGLRKAFEAIREDLSVGSAESPAGSERAEQELYACLDRIGAGLTALETPASNGGSADAVQNLNDACTRARQLIRRREDIIAQLR